MEILLLFAFLCGALALGIYLSKTQRSRHRRPPAPAPAPSPAPAPEPPRPSGKVCTYKVAGVSQYTDTILGFSYDDSDYDMTKREIIDSGMTDEKIWRYGFTPRQVDLVPDPENEHDHNAVNVLVDGQLVGYIKRGSCAHIRNLLANNAITAISCEIGGGPYKLVEEYEDEDSGRTMYDMSHGESDLFVHLHISERQAD